jgi:hypothetical protein
MKLDKKTAKRVRRARQERVVKAARLGAKRKRGLLRLLVATGSGSGP